MAETWPSTLPECVEKESWVVSPVDAVLRGNVDIGPAQKRNRYTTAIYLITFKMQMTKTQVDTLMDWYHDTLNRVLTFEFTDPFTETLVEMGFLVPPSATHFGVEEFIVTFNVETV